MVWKERSVTHPRLSPRPSATRRELLAIVTFTRHFRHYLLGRKFTILTDHRALQCLHNFKDPDGITARWLEKLASFDYDVRQSLLDMLMDCHEFHRLSIQ